MMTTMLPATASTAAQLLPTVNRFVGNAAATTAAAAGADARQHLLGNDNGAFPLRLLRYAPELSHFPAELLPDRFSMEYQNSAH